MSRDCVYLCVLPKYTFPQQELHKLHNSAHSSLYTTKSAAKPGWVGLYSLPILLTTLSFKTPIQFILIRMAPTKTSKSLLTRIMNTFRRKNFSARRFKNTHLTTYGDIVEIGECLRGMLHYCHCEFYACFFIWEAQSRGNGGS